MAQFNQKNPIESYLRRKSRGSYITTTLSIALVLFILGVFASIAIFGRDLARKAQDSIVLKIEMADGIKTARLTDFEMNLKTSSFVQSYKYVSKDEALETWQIKTGDQVENLGGSNPFRATYEVKLEREYIRTDSLDAISNRLKEDNLVLEVYYPTEQIFKMNEKLLSIQQDNSKRLFLQQVCFKIDID